MSVMIAAKRFDVIEGLSYVPRTQDIARLWAWLLLEHLQGDCSYQEDDLCTAFLRDSFGVSATEIDLQMRLWTKQLFELLREVGVIELHASSMETTSIQSSRSWRRVPWWRPAASGDKCKVHETSVNLEALGPASVSDAAGGPSSTGGRRSLRWRRACAVCARFDWDHEDVYLWEREKPDIGINVFRTGSAVRSVELEDPMDDGSASEATTPSTSSGLTPRELAHGLFFSPESYQRRWSFRRADGSVGGIPLEELQASAVCEPGTGRLWLFHKKVFTLKLEEGSQRMVADADQAVPMCKLCLCALQRKRPLMPTWALANDFWQGKLPRVLQNLGEIPWLLLALVRPLIKRHTWFPSKGNVGDTKECSQGFHGNVSVYPQRDGGGLLLSLPPPPDILKKAISIAFVGSESDMKRAYERKFRLNLETFKAAYEYLRGVNAVCDRVVWDEEVAQEYKCTDDDGHCLLGLPPAFFGCVWRAEADVESHLTVQEGAADAVSDGLGCPRADCVTEEAEVFEREQDSYLAGVDEDHASFDGDLSATKITMLLKQQALAKAERRDVELNTQKVARGKGAWCCRV